MKPKLTEDLISKAADLIRKNHTITDCCVLLDIAQQTFFRWMKEGKESPEGSNTLQRQFYLAVEQAKVAWKQEALQYLSQFKETQTTVTESVNDDGEMVEVQVVTTTKDVNRNHIKWLLSRRFKDEFGDGDDVNSENDKDSEPEPSDFERQLYGDE